MSQDQIDKTQDKTDTTQNDEDVLTGSQWEMLNTQRHQTTTRIHGDKTNTGKLSPHEVINEYESFGTPEGTRPSVLSHQVSAEVGETIFNNTELTKMYSYERGENEVTTAWRIDETTDALVRYETKRGDNEWETHWWLPPFGETQLDLRWMTIHTLARDSDITITYCSGETLEGILRFTRPEHAAGMEQVIRSQIDTNGNTETN